MLWLYITAGIVFVVASYFVTVGITFGVLFRRRITKKTIYLKPFFGEHFTKHTAAIEKTQKHYEEKPFEEVSIISGDLTLKGRFYENPKSNKIFIFVHGYYSYGTHDIGYFGNLHEELGVSLLIIDQRACGASEGRYTSLGILERFDVREWLFYLDGRFNGEKELYLHGVSMGAATSLLVSALPGLPKTLKGVIADCGFSRTNGVLLYAGNRLLRIRPKLLMWGIKLYTRFVGGFRLGKIKVSSELRKNTAVPVLFIHGTDDKFVPFNMSVKNFKSASTEDKKLVAVANAEHCESYLVNKDMYLKEVKEFINNA